MCLGHESSGVIVQLGSNVAAQAAQAAEAAKKLASTNDKSVGQTKGVVGKRALQLGDNVTMEPGVTCRMCTDCRSGRYQVGYQGLYLRIPINRADLQICEHMAFAAYPPFDGTLQRYYKL